MSKKNKTHPTQSFAQMVSNSNVKSLEPVVQQMVEQQSQKVAQVLSSQLIDALAGVQTRLMVLERVTIEKLGISKEDLGRRILEVEDEATGHKETDTIERGDLVRVTLRATKEGMVGTPPPTPVILRHVGEPLNQEAPYQSYRELEEALIGKKTGDVVDVQVQVPTAGEYTFNVVIDRVSRPTVTQGPVNG
jgi:hypothetical protein